MLSDGYPHMSYGSLRSCSILNHRSAIEYLHKRRNLSDWSCSPRWTLGQPRGVLGVHVYLVSARPQCSGGFLLTSNTSVPSVAVSDIEMRIPGPPVTIELHASNVCFKSLLVR